MAIEILPAFGWAHCARLANAHAELIVTLDVGPRILSYRTAPGENVLRTMPDQLGGSGETAFMARGGHRLWISPEKEWSYAPDNRPVAHQIEGNTLRVSNAATAPWHIRKEIAISLAADSTAVTLRHRLTNESAAPAELAAWALTVLRPGGVEIIPQPPLGQHGKGGFLPQRVVVPWTYTDFSDPRWSFGRRYWLLRPKDGTEATKMGLLHQPGWAAYALPDALFLKTVPLVPGASYPDLGCNFETFTKGDFIELETLSPLQTLAPGASVELEERWHLFGGIAPLDPLDEAAIEASLRPHLSQITLP